METVTSFNRLELLQVADAVAREKAIERDVVLMAMEDAIQKAARSRYGLENDIHAEIDRKTGEIRLERHLQVVDKIENVLDHLCGGVRVEGDGRASARGPDVAERPVQVRACLHMDDDNARVPPWGPW